MAFFLVRSALCIGAVAVAASGLGPVTDALPGHARGAADAVARACLASAACLRAAGAAVASAAPVPTAQAAAPGGSGAGGTRLPGSPRR